MTTKNLQWLKCAACEANGKDSEDPNASCAVCGGIGSLVFCTCCLSYQQYDHRYPQVCRPCTGEALATVGRDVERVPAAIEAIRAKWAAFEREAALDAIKPTLVEYANAMDAAVAL